MEMSGFLRVSLFPGEVPVFFKEINAVQSRWIMLYLKRNFV